MPTRQDQNPLISLIAKVISQTSAAKTAVTLCFQEEGALGNCNGAQAAGDYRGIPADFNVPQGNVQSLNTAAGEITVVGIAPALDATGNGTGEDYILTPTVNGNNLNWAVNANSTCIAANLCRQ